MTLLDAYALIALLLDEPVADEIEPLLRAGDAAITAVNLAEVADVAQRVHGASDWDVRATLDLLVETVLELRVVGAGEAWRAADIRRRHYHRGSSPLSLADCFLLAAAREGESIATADPPVAAAARAEGVTVVPLPDRTGNRP